MTTSPTQQLNQQPRQLSDRLSDRHPAWCARAHRCGLGEHRSTPITVDVPGAGALVLTRVRAADGIEHVDVRLSVLLPGAESHARLRVAALLTHLTTLIGPDPTGHLRRAA